mgnify:FL=1
MQIAISQKVKNEIKDYFYITLGLLIYTFGWTIFLLPYQIVTGGVTGIAAVIFYGTGIPIYLSYFLINSSSPVSSPLKYCRYNSSSEIISCTSFPL